MDTKKIISFLIILALLVGGFFLVRKYDGYLNNTCLNHNLVGGHCGLGAPLYCMPIPQETCSGLRMGCGFIFYSK